MGSLGAITACVSNLLARAVASCSSEGVANPTVRLELQQAQGDPQLLTVTGRWLQGLGAAPQACAQRLTVSSWPSLLQCGTMDWGRPAMCIP